MTLLRLINPAKWIISKLLLTQRKALSLRELRVPLWLTGSESMHPCLAENTGNFVFLFRKPVHCHFNTSNMELIVKQKAAQHVGQMPSIVYLAVTYLFFYTLIKLIISVKIITWTKLQVGRLYYKNIEMKAIDNTISNTIEYGLNLFLNYFPITCSCFTLTLLIHCSPVASIWLDKYKKSLTVPVWQLMWWSAGWRTVQRSRLYSEF